jgi:hypothetical protein
MSAVPTYFLIVRTVTPLSRAASDGEAPRRISASACKARSRAAKLRPESLDAGLFRGIALRLAIIPRCGAGTFPMRPDEVHNIS